MTAAFVTGDAIRSLRQFPDEMFHCCVTSPPYWKLRDYQINGQFGLEMTPRQYVSNMVNVFQEVHRVLRNDATLWLNIDDCYLKDGNLAGIPWLLALGLRDDGWTLRSEIVWAKPNPLPESSKSRPTNCTEKIFLLTKYKKYFYDAEAVREPTTGNAHSRGKGVNPKASNNRAVSGRQNASWSAAVTEPVSMRNMRNVWTFTVKPFSGDHHATFPPNIPEIAIKAGTSEHGACPCCGAPFRRLVEKGEPDLQHQRACGGDAAGAYSGQSQKDYAAARAQDASETKRRILAGMVGRKTIGWAQTCPCPPAPPVPCLVLDPFVGSGTTAMVAERLGRDSVGIDLDPRSITLARQRVTELK